MKISFRLILFFLAVSAAANAGELKEIELTDGSVVAGEVVSLSNGRYTIRTESMGTISVSDSRVKSIHPRGAAPTSAASSSSTELSTLTEKMLSDQQTMEVIQSLKDDPDFQKALDDPEIRKAVSSGDTATLLANPKFLQLMSNPKVREIQEKVAK